MKLIMLFLTAISIVFLAIQIAQMYELRKLNIGRFKNKKGEVVIFEYENINERYIVKRRDGTVIIGGSHMFCKNYLRQNNFEQMEEN